VDANVILNQIDFLDRALRKKGFESALDPGAGPNFKEVLSKKKYQQAHSKGSQTGSEAGWPVSFQLSLEADGLTGKPTPCSGAGGLVGPHDA
jgi:hypothetical protein